MRHLEMALVMYGGGPSRGRPTVKGIEGASGRSRTGDAGVRLSMNSKDADDGDAGCA